MANGMTIDALYEAFMDLDTDDPTPFAEDVFEFFGKETLSDLDKEQWAAKYGMYLPTFDPAQLHLAERERDLAYRDAMNTLETTHAATERVYATEMDTLSSSLGRELGKGREMAGRTGLRSGDLEGAIQDTIATTGSKAKDFGDRVRISKEDIDNTYNNAMVDAALDYDKTVRQEKEEFYDRTMAAIMRLMDREAFDDPEALCTCSPAVGGGSSSAVNDAGECTYTDCPSDACGTVNGSVTDPLQCMGGTPTTTIDGNTITGTCEYGSCDFTAGCQQVCTGAGANMYGGGVTMCIQDCTGAMAGGAGTWGGDQWVLDTMQQVENEMACPEGGSWEPVGDTFEYVCASGDDEYSTQDLCCTSYAGTQYPCGSSQCASGCFNC